MSEENPGWQEPPFPEEPQITAEEPPKMSVFQTLIDIFHAPAEVFEDLRKMPFPRLVVPLVLCAILVTGYSFLLNQKLGNERIVKEQLSSKWMEQLPDEAKKKMLDDARNASPVNAVITSLIGGLFFLIIFLLLGLIYWGLGLAFGGEGNFWHGVAVASYSTFPPLLISMLGSCLILFLKDPDEISFFSGSKRFI